MRYWTIKHDAFPLRYIVRFNGPHHFTKLKNAFKTLKKNQSDSQVMT